MDTNKITKKEIKAFQTWLEEKSKGDIISNAAAILISNNEGICQNGEYELKSYETKSGHEEIFRFEQKIKLYCTQNDGNCNACSLVNYGKDCKNNSI